MPMDVMPQYNESQRVRNERAKSRQMESRSYVLHCTGSGQQGTCTVWVFSTCIDRWVDTTSPAVHKLYDRMCTCNREADTPDYPNSSVEARYKCGRRISMQKDVFSSNTTTLRLFMTGYLPPLFCKTPYERRNKCNFLFRKIKGVE